MYVSTTVTKTFDGYDTTDPGGLPYFSWYSIQKWHSTYQMAPVYTNVPQNTPNKIPNGYKYTEIFHSKAIKNIPKIGILGVKIYHLATLDLG
jgi:hypothetical protein